VGHSASCAKSRGAIFAKNSNGSKKSKNFSFASERTDRREQESTYGVLLASFDPFLSGYDESRGHEFYRRLVERVSTVPGIQSATLARRLPLTDGGIAFANVAIDGYAPAKDRDMRLNYETVGPQYFQTMRIPFVHGRDFDERDQEDARGVVIINETLARRYWPGGDAVGRRLKPTKDWLEIVGIAKDVKYRSLSEAPQPFLYLPLLQDYRSNMILVARTAIEPEKMFQPVRAEVAALDPEIPIFDFKTFEEQPSWIVDDANLHGLGSSSDATPWGLVQSQALSNRSTLCLR
jgi:hypothetical protein